LRQGARVIEDSRRLTHGLPLDQHSHPSARRYTEHAAEGRRHVSVA
jgi:hypothetical protein